MSTLDRRKAGWLGHSAGQKSERLVKELGRNWGLIRGFWRAIVRRHGYGLRCFEVAAKWLGCHSCSILKGAVRMAVVLGTVRGTHKYEPRNGKWTGSGHDAEVSVEH